MSLDLSDIPPGDLIQRMVLLRRECIDLVGTDDRASMGPVRSECRKLIDQIFNELEAVKAELTKRGYLT